MGANNGSGQTARLQKEALLRYGSELMSIEGVITAALSEPVCPACKPKCKHTRCAYQEDREASKFWDYALLNSIRAMDRLDPLESFTGHAK